MSSLLSPIDRRCKVCAQAQLIEVKAFQSLTRVTSDTRPFPAGGRLSFCEACGAVQKLDDARWREEVSGIYASYAMYSQSDGAEQRVFDPDGGSQSRSSRLLERALPEMRLPERGALLDIGCGTGVTLEAFAALRPGWDLYGQDLDDRCAERLARIPGFRGLLRDLKTPGIPRFDAISLIHSLEHLEDPGASLSEIAALLTDTGCLLVEVPDADTSPFDLVVADHLCHFDAAALRLLVERADYVVEVCGAGWLPKELSLLARPGEPPASAPPTQRAAEVSSRVEAQVDWLGGLVASAREASEAQVFGIFGTAIAGTWLYGALEGRVDFFVDEDPARIGRHHCGKPILAPERVPSGARVYVPLIPSVARDVRSRYAHLGVRFEAPPPIGPVASRASRSGARSRTVASEADPLPAFTRRDLA